MYIIYKYKQGYNIINYVISIRVFYIKIYDNFIWKLFTYTSFYFMID